MEKVLPLLHLDDLISEADNINDAKIFSTRSKQWLVGDFNLRNLELNSTELKTANV